MASGSRVVVVIARVLQRLARRVYRRLASRRPDAFPAGSLEQQFDLFDTLQADAYARGGWLGLVRYWFAEAGSLSRLVRAPTAFVRHDIRDALRGLRRTPGYAAIVIATLALGIGANTAIFSVVDALLFKPLPYSDADRLVVVAERHPSGGLNTVAPLNFLDWRVMTRSFSFLEARVNRGLALLDGGEPVEVRGARVTAGYFDMLGVRPIHGRLFQPGDDRPGAPCAAVISHDLWTRRFAANRSVIGEPLRFTGQTCLLIGVLPADSVFDRMTAEVYWPLTMSRASASRRSHLLTVWGRLAPDVTLASAETEIVSVASAIHRSDAGQTLEWSAAVTPLRDRLVRANARQLVWVLFGAVTLVLLVSCVNVAGLALSRTVARQHEVAVRASLGAGRWRLFRHLVVESLVLAAAGGVCGFLCGHWLLRLFGQFVPAGALPAEAIARLDLRALLFTGGVAATTALVFGTLPAWQGARAATSGALRAAGRSLTGSRMTARLHNSLLVCEVALATVLVAAAALLVVSFMRLTSVDPGFDPDRLLTFRLSLPDTGYDTDPEIVAFFQDVEDRLERIGGVQQVAAVTSLPLGGWQWGVTFQIEGQPVDPERPPSAHIQHVVGPYFATLGIPLVDGRGFTPDDDARAPRVLVVNETFARRHLPDGPAVGRRLHLGSPPPPGEPLELWTVVGVMRDLKTGSLADAVLATPEVYVPHAQWPMKTMYVALRTRGPDPMSVRADAAAAVYAVDPEVPLGRTEPMTRLIGSSVTTERFRVAAMSAFAMLALLLAGLGVYAVRSQAVASRWREIGIRMALGATGAEVVALLLGQGMRLVAVGLLVGIGAALSSARVIETWLFGTDATDPATLSAAVVLLAAAALLASWLPARRALRADPMTTLRAD